MDSESRTFATAIFAACLVMLTNSKALVPSAEERSLGDVAREQRKKQEKESKKPVHVFSNDNLPGQPPDLRPAPLKTALWPGEKSGAAEEGFLTPAVPRIHNEEYYRTEMNRLRRALEKDQDFLARLQAELDLHDADVPVEEGMSANIQDRPRWAANPFGAYAEWESEDQWLRKTIDSTQKKIGLDQKAILDLVEQCRRENCRPSWVR